MEFFCANIFALTLLCGQQQQLVPEQQQPVVVADAVLQNFRQRQGIKPDYDLQLQAIDSTGSGEGDISLPDGAVVSLDNMEPRSIFSATAQCFQDGELSACPESTVFMKMDEENGRRTLMAKDENGDMTSIMVTTPSQESSTSDHVLLFEAVAPGIVALIPQEAYNEAYYDQFILADPLSSSLDEKLHRHLRKEGIRMSHDKQRQLQNDEPCVEYREIEVALAIDSSFCEGVGGPDAVGPMINSIMARVAVEFEAPGLCFTAVISHLEEFCVPATDPYREAILENDVTNLITFFRDFWNENRQKVNRDVAELITGTGLECRENGNCVIGQASAVGTMCTDMDRDSYGVNYLLFSDNPFAMSNVLAHEIGHILGAFKDDSNINYIMYPGIGDFNQFFGPTSVDMFLSPRNEECITCLDLDAPCVVSVPNCCEGLTCRETGFFDLRPPTCQEDGLL